MVGLLGKKLGQTRVYTEEGRSVSVTIVQAGPNQVLQRKTTGKDGYEAVQLGFDGQKEHRLNLAKRGHLKPVGEWNHEKVTVDGPLVKVELNGVVILDANLDELNKQKPKHKGAQRRSGHLCFCGHGAPVKFKNITIKELPSKKP